LHGWHGWKAVIVAPVPGCTGSSKLCSRAPCDTPVECTIDHCALVAARAGADGRHSVQSGCAAQERARSVACAALFLHTACSLAGQGGEAHTPSVGARHLCCAGCPKNAIFNTGLNLHFVSHPLVVKPLRSVTHGAVAHMVGRVHYIGRTSKWHVFSMPEPRAILCHAHLRATLLGARLNLNPEPQCTRLPETVLSCFELMRVHAWHIQL